MYPTHLNPPDPNPTKHTEPHPAPPPRRRQELHPLCCVTAPLLQRGLAPGLAVEYDAIESAKVLAADEAVLAAAAGDESKGEAATSAAVDSTDPRARFHVNAMTSTGMDGIMHRYGRVAILPVAEQQSAAAAAEVKAAARFDSDADDILDDGSGNGNGNGGGGGGASGSARTVRVRVLDRAGYLDFWRERCIDEREQVWRELSRLGLVIDEPFAEIYARGSRGAGHAGVAVPASALTAPPSTAFEAATAKAAGMAGGELRVLWCGAALCFSLPCFALLCFVVRCGVVLCCAVLSRSPVPLPLTCPHCTASTTVSPTTCLQRNR